MNCFFWYFLLSRPKLPSSWPHQWLLDFSRSWG